MNVVDDHSPAASPPGTGDPHVDDALARLETLAEIPLDQHAEVYEAVYHSLGAVLDGTVDQQPPAS